MTNTPTGRMTQSGLSPQKLKVNALSLPGRIDQAKESPAKAFSVR